MSILDSSLSRIAGAPASVADLASKVGLHPATTEQLVAVLVQCHLAPGDTVELAARKTRREHGQLQGIVAALGGEAALRAIATDLTQGLGDLGKWTLRDELALFFPRLFGKAG